MSKNVIKRMTLKDKEVPAKKAKNVKGGAQFDAFHSGGVNRPQESLSLNFTKIEYR